MEIKTRKMEKINKKCDLFIVFMAVSSIRNSGDFTP